jgi:hypothetical protein
MHQIQRIQMTDHGLDRVPLFEAAHGELSDYDVCSVYTSQQSTSHTFATRRSRP